MINFIPTLRRMRTLCLLLAGLSSAALFGQSYPRWFLYPDEVRCPHVAVGYAQSFHYKDSAVVRAFRFACDVSAINRRSTIVGSNAFWATEGGTVQMSSEFEESFDEQAASEALGRYVVLDKYLTPQMTIVLAGDSSCLGAGFRREILSISQDQKPEWITQLPVERGYEYAVGLAERYYYETSSWNIAEQHARLSLARQKHTKLESLQKSTVVTGEALQRETVSATLEGVEIVARWSDPRDGVLYVLSRMKSIK
jgi:hypothetical protein